MWFWKKIAKLAGDISFESIMDLHYAHQETQKKDGDILVTI